MWVSSRELKILDQTLFGWVAQEGAQRINWG